MEVTLLETGIVARILSGDVKVWVSCVGKRVGPGSVTGLKLI